MDTELTGTDTQAPFIQLLSPDGTRRQDPAWDRYTRDVDLEALRGFYRDMAATRRLDDEGTALQRQGQLVLWVPLKGQEAAQIGSGRATLPQDYLFPTYREHGVAITRGVQIAEMLRVFRGISHGGWNPASTGFHNYTMVLAAQTLHAVGYAMGVQRDQKGWEQERLAAEGGAVMAFFGDGASSEGDVHESMVFAASTQAPVVFFCQNNQWAISVPFEVQSRVPLVNRAAGYGFPAVRVDGNDVLAVHAVTRWALECARTGQGPVLIEAVTYRRGAHTTADDPTKYRTRHEEEGWDEKDPLLRLERHLRAAGTGDDFFEAVKEETDRMAAELRATALAFPTPALEESFANVYASPHPLVQEELAFYREYQAGFADGGAASDTTDREDAK
ncbi:MAG: thiamine pyrophosphate-dependent dehydrogenase E1 component subunit alpha [Arthrobacter sp.]|nr:thiamine pyrophosphate-dependent dehydrogenase E1 component subunit alpha [Arthrobacter sp.]